MRPTIERQPISMTEVTLRDGMQQDNLKPVTIDDRLDILETLIDAGMERIEIGHIGNEDGEDIAFARAVTRRVIDAETEGSERYKNVKFQVLLGSQPKLVARGVAALEGLDKDRFIVHVYDRVSPNLRGLASEPYDTMESAGRVFNAARIAYEHGFEHFSISGEGATDPDIGPEEMTDFYVSIVEALQHLGAKTINCNLANTFGDSVGDADVAILEYFNARVKQGYDNVTTSIHVHNDHNDSVGYSLAAIRAGFDRVEGTLIGMGERSGNVAIADVIVRLLEDARNRIDREANADTMRFLGARTVRSSIWQDHVLEPSVASSLARLYDASEHICEVFGDGARARFEKTSLGSPSAYDAGSGPHAHANREFLRDPLAHPIWKNYGKTAIQHAIMGRPEAIEIIQVDVDRIKSITINTHAAGGSTHQVLEDKILVAPIQERAESEARARAYMAQIVDMTAGANNIGRKLSSDPDVRAYQLGTLDFDVEQDWMSPSRRRAAQAS